LKGETGLEGFLWSLGYGDWPLRRMLIGISSISVDEDDEDLDCEEVESDSICIKCCVEEVPDIASDSGASSRFSASAVTSI